MRGFKTTSSLFEGNLALAIAPALTPNGIEEDPLFFCGEFVNPVVISRVKKAGAITGANKKPPVWVNRHLLGLL